VKRVLAVVAIASAFACAKDESPLGPTERQSLSGAIYFVSERGEKPAAWRVRPDGSGETLVLSGDDAAYPYGTDKKRVAFVKSSGEDDELVLADPDGKNQTAIAPSGGGLNWYPTYSPDGEWILFESNRDAFRELYKISARGGQPLRLTNNREGNFDGAWSPDGKSIAFASSRFNQLDLFVMDADGSNQRRLTQFAGDTVKPAWSPDGKLIAFISARDGRDNLFVISPETKEARNITPGKDEVESFVWQPGHDTIVYAARAADRKSKLRSVDVENGTVRELSGAADNDSNPSFSPDGNFLVFASSIDGKSDLWIARADGGRRTRLTQDPRGAWLPRWLEIGEEKR
jgi:TolB protein